MTEKKYQDEESSVLRREARRIGNRTRVAWKRLRTGGREYVRAPACRGAVGSRLGGSSATRAGLRARLAITARRTRADRRIRTVPPRREAMAATKGRPPDMTLGRAPR